MAMTFCAGQSAKAADARLNEAYRAARDTARELDDGLVDMFGLDAVPTETMLRDAQRAWIVFRDRACEAEASVARGGTMTSQLYLLCTKRLTQTRTEDLLRFGQQAIK